MISMPPRAKLDASSRPEKDHLHSRSSRSHLECGACAAQFSCLDRNQGETADPVGTYRFSLKASKKLKRRGASGIAMKDWNVVITVNNSEGFRRARREFQRFGDVELTDYHNVLVLRVPNVPKFIELFSSITEADKSLLNCVSRVAPAGFAFDFQTPKEFRNKARAIVLGWRVLLCGRSFHVRMHRRGLKSELPSPSVEQFLDDAILSGARERGRPSWIDFADPDYVIDVETVGNRACLTLWTRNDLRRLPFLRVD